MRHETQQDIVVRELEVHDSVADLTAVINLAYSAMMAQGWNMTGSYQGVETTLERIAKGTCLVAIQQSQIIGTAMLTTMFDEGDPELYKSPGAGVLGQFAVHPEFQGQGVGSMLVTSVEREAKRLGLTKLALDTVETASDLIEYYQKRGFRPVGHVQWWEKTYRSVLMVKELS